MKQFIFPNNYNKKEKFLGIVDYRALAILGIISAILFFVLRGLEINIKLKVIIVVLVIVPPVITLLIGINGENTVDVIKYMVKFYFKDRIYVYKKTKE